MAIRQQGQYFQADFFDLTGGLNTTDSPFRVQATQATGGSNYEYALTGGVRKKKGATKVNAVADSISRTIYTGQHVTSANVKTVLRGANQNIEKVNLTTGSFTLLTQDDVSNSTTFFAGGTTQGIVSTQFNTGLANTLWLAGGGAQRPIGVYSSTKATVNGMVAPSGAFTATRSGAGAGTWASTGTYFYAIAYHKGSTLVLSNAVLDVSATVSVVTDKVTVDISGIGGITSLPDTIYLYRSAVGGVSGFTTGDLVAKINLGTTTYDDTGTYIATSQNIPRAGNTILDNSPFPIPDIYPISVITTWKRRLVSAIGSTLYCSDVNKPESWPLLETITIPSGGPITGLGIISFTTPTSSTIDELLVVFKEQELWVVTGSALSTGSLQFIDTVGCTNQSLIVYANGYLSWIDYRGIYLWDGSGKPIYASRLIEDLFAEGGNLDKTKLSIGWGVFIRSKSQVLWVVSGVLEGEQRIALKLDLKLTLPNIQSNLGGRVLDAILIKDTLAYPLYAGSSILPATAEVILAGDASGFLYTLLNNNDDAGAAVDFSYETPFHDMGTVGTAKRFVKLVVWVEDSSTSVLTVDYWTRYNSGPGEAKQVAEVMSNAGAEALWDLAYWDVDYWDNTDRAFRPIVYNLTGEGDCIKLKFSQASLDSPTTIAGYSVIYSEIGLRK